MADNYLLFSEIVPKLGPDEEAWLQAQRQQIAVHGDEETAIDGLDDQAIEGADWYGPRFLRDYGDFDFESDTLGFAFCFQDDTDPGGWGRHLWVFAEEGGDPNHVVHLVREFLKRFRPDQCWSLTYATTCSKLRTGAFGGGGIFVTADEIRWQNAYEFVEQQRAAFEKAKGTP